MNTAVAAKKTSPPAPALATVAPILAASHKQIRALGALRSTSLNHIQRAVEGDAALALNLFTEVNAKLKQAGRAPVADIQRAILFLGMADLPARLTRGAILEDVVAPDQVEAFTQMLCRAHHAAWQAHAIASLAHGLNANELLSASLAREGLPFVAALADQTDIDLNISAFKNFLPALPDNLDARRLSEKCLAFAGRFADVTARAWDEEALNLLYTELEDATGCDVDTIAKSLGRATVHAARSGSHFRAYPAAIHLMSPGAPITPVPPAQNMPKRPPKRAAPTSPAAAAQSSKNTAKPALAKAKAAPKPKAALTPQAPVESTEVTPSKPARAKPATKRTSDAKSKAFAGALNSLEKAVSDGRPAVEIMPLSLQGICAHAGIELAVLLMLDKKTGDLNLRLAEGASLPDALKHVPIPVARNPLLKKLLNAEAAFHWRTDKHRQTLSGVPLKLLGDQDGFLYSLVIAGKPLGIIMGRGAHASPDECSESFARFKKICVATRRSLESSARAGK